MAWFTSPAAWRAIGKGVVSKGWGGTKAVGRVGRKAAVLGTVGAVGMGVNPFLGAGLGKLLGGMGSGGGRLAAGGGITGGADTGTVGPGAGRDSSIVAGMRPHSPMQQINVGTLKPNADFRSLLTYAAKSSQATYLTTLRNNRELIYIQKMLQGPTAARAKELRMESGKGRAPIIVVAGGGEGEGREGAGLGALLPFAGLAGLLAGAAVAGSQAPTTGTPTTTPALGAGDVLFRGSRRHMGSRYQDYQRWLRGEEARLKGEAKVNKLRADLERALRDKGGFRRTLRIWKLQRALAAAEASLLRSTAIAEGNRLNQGEAERFAEESRRWRERMNRLRIAAAAGRPAAPIEEFKGYRDAAEAHRIRTTGFRDTGNEFKGYRDAAEAHRIRTTGFRDTGNEFRSYRDAAEAHRIRTTGFRGAGDTFEDFTRNTLRTSDPYGRFGTGGADMGADRARARGSDPYGRLGSAGMIGALSRQAAVYDLVHSSTLRSFTTGAFTEGNVGAGGGRLSGADVYNRSAARQRASVVGRRAQSLRALDLAIDAKFRGGRMPGGGWSYPYGMNPDPAVFEKALTAREKIRWRAVQNQIAIEIKGIKPSKLFRAGQLVERFFAKFGRVGGAIFLAVISGYIVWAAIVAYRNQVGAVSEKAERMMGMTGMYYPGIEVAEGGRVPNKLGLDAGSVKTEGSPMQQLAAAMAGLGSGLMGGFAFGILGAAFAQMAIPFPGTGIIGGLIGGLVGWIAGEHLGRKIFDIVVNSAERKKRQEKKTAAFAGAMGNIAEVYGRHTLQSPQGGIGTNVGGMHGDFGGEVRHHGFFPKAGSPGFDASRGNYLSGGGTNQSLPGMRDVSGPTIITPSAAGTKQLGMFSGAINLVKSFLGKRTSQMPPSWEARSKKEWNTLLIQPFKSKIKRLISIMWTKYGLDVVINEGARNKARTEKLNDEGVRSAKWGKSLHNYGAAVDLIWGSGRPDGKVVDPYLKNVSRRERKRLWKLLGSEAKKLGLIWGGDWKEPDETHFQTGQFLYGSEAGEAGWDLVGADIYNVPTTPGRTSGTGPDFSHVRGIGQQIRYDAFGRASGGQSQHLGRNVHGWTSIPNATVPPSALNMPGGGGSQVIINNITNSSDAGTQQFALTIDANEYNQFGGPLAPLSGQGDMSTTLVG